MAGWSFVVTTQTPAAYAADIDRDAILAHWITGASGIRWIDRLVDGDWAEQNERGGYPNVTTALARDVVPLFEPDRIPSSEESTFAPWDVRIDREALRRLAPDTPLTVVVWDQS